MRRSLSRNAFRSLSRRRVAVDDAAQPDRPAGPLIWAHATSAPRLEALCDIGARLQSLRPEVHVLVSVDPTLTPAPPAAAQGCDWLVPVPQDGQAQARQFLDHWHPALGVWTGGHLRPALIRTASTARIPMILIDADASGFGGRKRGWFSDPARDALSRFAQVLASNAAAATAMQRHGLAPARITVTGQLHIGPNPPVCVDADVAAVTQQLVGRPTWLAASVGADEFAPVLSAHRTASRFAHRLLLVIAPDRRDDVAALLALLETEALRHAVWQPGDAIGDNTQVLVVDDAADPGLWHRVCPQTFIGDSLNPAGQGRSPLDTAALGSAVLYGPNVAAHRRAYSRLSAAGAARLVVDGDALGGEVSRLIAPDRAAAMALAGWDVVTEGAELTDRVLTMIQTYLDADDETADARA